MYIAGCIITLMLARSISGPSFSYHVLYSAENIKLGEQASSYDRVKSSENLSPKTNYKISLNCQKHFRALKLDQTLTEACLLMKSC